MKRHAVIIIGFFIIFAVLGGCSSGGDIPVTPGIPGDTTLQPPGSDGRGSEDENANPFGGVAGGGGLNAQSNLGEAAGHYLMLLYNLDFNLETGEVDIAQVRSGEVHYNVTQMLQPPECLDCLKVQVMGKDPVTKVYTLKVTIKNPSDHTAYDVRGIVFIGDPEDEREIVNADNYTKIFDSGNPPNKNPYRAFNVGTTKRAFAGGSSTSLLYEMFFGAPPNFQMTFAVDVSFPGNMKDPYDITEIDVQGAMDTTGINMATISCDVLDWQGNEDIEYVKLDISSLGGGVDMVEMNYGSGDTYTISLANSFEAPASTYTFEISAKSLNNSQVLFDYVDVDVEPYNNLPPMWMGGIVGVASVVALDMSAKVNYGFALDPDAPLVYAIYCSSVSPIDFDTIHPEIDDNVTPYIYEGLENGQEYFFAVRARDGLMLEDDNENEASAIPNPVNYPPEWVVEKGIIDAVPGPYQVSVWYGEAIDPDEPVTYTVYYDQLFDFQWDTAETKEGNTGSPTLVTGLMNGLTYEFGVRARDDTGLEDTNGMRLPAMPMNLPPAWDEFPGGIREANPGDGEVEVVFGTATDFDSQGGDVVYNVYYSTEVFSDQTVYDNAGKLLGETGSPVIVGPLPNGMLFYFAVRAEDEFGLEENNMQFLDAIPQNQPPVWDGPVGVQNLIPDNEQITVEYGTALDPDVPITYNVYYSVQQEGFWFLADKLEGETGSPTVISGLVNDIEWFVGVRAVDGLGLEEHNDIVLSATPSYDNQPPVWDGPVGVQSIVPGDQEVTVNYGTVSDPDPLIMYIVYYSENTPIDFVTAVKVPDTEGSPTVVGSLINGQTYYFAVRAQDGLGLEDENIVELPGTPVNQPPIWDDTVGIVDVQANDEFALVYFGTASDPSMPITYNVYWDDQTPIDFDTCDSSVENLTAPVFVDGLTNGQMYWFAVRAQDDEGLEDTNTVELSATPEEKPPVWDDTIGVQTVLPGVEQATVFYGTASDPDEPVTYNVYYSLDSPIDFGTAWVMEAQSGSPTVVTDLINDLEYHFAVRARDATGMEDSNTVELAATPTYDNQPPEWDGFPGIQDAQAGDHTVTVYYGTATDPDLPVTYNVYWSDSSPINFITANKKIGEIGSPTVVGELINDTPYYFAVRAMDGLGLEDTNIFEMMTIPMNDAPVWDDTIGIMGIDPDNEQVTVYYGTASDPDVPVTYTVYYSPFSPIDFDVAEKLEGETGSPSVVTGLTNDLQYFFAVRARDGEGLEDHNTVELAATPSSGNTPPVWDDEVGIQSLTPLSESIEATYGTASDPDLPVTYRVYYEGGAPINWDTSPYVTDDESPTVVDGLDNAEFYFFGVRAVDDLGLEEENEEQLTMFPNLPPEWISTVGIIEAVPMLAKAEIYFGEAEDVDGVSYNIYYSDTSPIDFDLAGKITDVLSSPHVIDVAPGKDVWYFGVRAIDDLGYEENNTIEASAEIWQDPESKWLLPTGAPVMSSPNWLDINSDGTDEIIIGGQDNLIKALSPEDGGVLWSYPALGAIDSSPCLADVNGGVLDVVYGSYDSSVYAVDGVTGDLLWSFPTDGMIISSPASGDVDDDGDTDIVIGSFDYSVYVIDAATGTEVWNLAGGDAMVSSPALYDVTGDGKLEVFIGCNDGRMYCFNGDGSAEVWHYTTAQPVRTSPVIGDVEGDGDKECIFVSDDGYLYVVDALTGDFRWNFNLGTSSLSSPALGDVNEDGKADIAIGAGDGQFYILDGATHVALWSASTLSPFNSTAALADLTGDGILDAIIGCDDGNLYCFDGVDGSTAFFFPVFDSIQVGPMIHDVDDDGLLEIILATEGGLVYALDTDTPVPGTADIIWPKFHRTVDNRGVL